MTEMLSPDTRNFILKGRLWTQLCLWRFPRAVPLFARRMATVSPNGGQGFGLWSLVTKASLAVAAVVLLPTLEAAGFAAGQATQPEAALQTLTYLYALVPLALKCLAIGLLAVTKLED